MDDVIWKYVLSGETGLHTPSALYIPKGGVVLHAGVQFEKICIWVKVDPDLEKTIREFNVCATGEPCPHSVDDYIGTVFMAGGSFVFHVFEIKEFG